MKNINDILSDIGYSDIPDIHRIEACMNDEFCSWVESIDFAEAIRFYGLSSHARFMELFQPYLELYNQNLNWQRAAFVLHHYLFDYHKYNWERHFDRSIEDMFAAIVLLSGYKIHLANMQRLNFDTMQIKKHKHRIYECCTIGFDTYRLSYMQDTQLKWGTLFINAHIYEIGRLQFEVNRYEYQLDNFDMKDEFCVDVHIPRGSKLDNSLVEEALKTAKEKLPHIYQELPANPKFFLSSWLLSKEVNNLLPENSNIKLFSKRFNILKSWTGSSLNHFLFDKYDWDIKKFPEDTSLRRVVKQKLLNGEKFYDATGILI